jgi:hypothetical protein
MSSHDGLQVRQLSGYTIGGGSGSETCSCVTLPLFHWPPRGKPPYAMLTFNPPPQPWGVRLRNMDFLGKRSLTLETKAPLCTMVCYVSLSKSSHSLPNLSDSLSTFPDSYRGLHRPCASFGLKLRRPFASLLCTSFTACCLSVIGQSMYERRFFRGQSSICVVGTNKEALSRY